MTQLSFVDTVEVCHDDWQKTGHACSLHLSLVRGLLSRLAPANTEVTASNSDNGLYFYLRCSSKSSVDGYLAGGHAHCSLSSDRCRHLCSGRSPGAVSSAGP